MIIRSFFERKWKNGGEISNRFLVFTSGDLEEEVKGSCVFLWSYYSELRNLLRKKIDNIQRGLEMIALQSYNSCVFFFVIIIIYCYFHLKCSVSATHVFKSYSRQKSYVQSTLE